LDCGISVSIEFEVVFEIEITIAAWFYQLFASSFFTIIAVLFDTIRGRTNHSVDSTHSSNVGKNKDNLCNYKIPYIANPQGSTVSKNPSKNDTIAVVSRLLCCKQ